MRPVPGRGCLRLAVGLPDDRDALIVVQDRAQADSNNFMIVDQE